MTKNSYSIFVHID